MDLSTKYLGLTLKNPIVPSSSSLSQNLDNVKRMEDAGAAAVTMYSLFEEQITHEQKELDHFLTFETDTHAEALSYFPEPEEYRDVNADLYLEKLQSIKKSVGVPVIASLNGVSQGGWMNYAKKMQEAGADALELNIYYQPSDPNLSSEAVESMYVDDLKTVKQAVSIPVTMKMSPFFTSFGNLVKRLDDEGADGFVLFNRFFGPNIDLEQMEVVPELKLSGPYELQLPLRWTAVLHGKIKASIAAGRGVQDAHDVAKLLLAGADVVTMASCLYRNGIDYVGTVLNGLQQWMEEKEYESVEQLKGSMSYQAVAEPTAYDRANYMKTLQSYA